VLVYVLFTIVIQNERNPPKVLKGMSLGVANSRDKHQKKMQDTSLKYQNVPPFFMCFVNYAST